MNDSDEMPVSWAKENLSKIVDYKKGKKPKKMERSPFKNSLVYLDIRAIEKGNDEIFVDVESSNITNETELVIVWDGARAGWVGKSRNGALGSTLMALKPKIDKDYLFRFLQTQFQYLQTNHRGTGIPHVDPDIFWNIPVPIAPLPEQQRIVAKLDALFEKIESNKQRLDKIPKLLKRFRQSVLAAAVSGELTNSEIERIPLADLIQDLKYGTSQKSEKNSKGIQILRIPNIEEGGRISIDDLKYADLPKNEYERLKLVPGDLLLIRSNGSVSLVGRTSIVTEKEKGFAYAGYLIRIRCNKELILPEYLNIAMASYDLRLQIEIPARSTSGVNNINSDEVKALEIPTPSLDDQLLIIERVSNLFAFADRIESRYAKAKAMLDKFPQSILAKAFRGELVSQNSEDESASVLLERINQEKEKHRQDKADKKVKKSKEYSLEQQPLKMVAEKKVKYKKA
jgi:type I restriction enzyme S subunit